MMGIKKALPWCYSMSSCLFVLWCIAIYSTNVSAVISCKISTSCCLFVISLGISGSCIVIAYLTRFLQAAFWLCISLWIFLLPDFLVCVGWNILLHLSHKRIFQVLWLHTICKNCDSFCDKPLCYFRIFWKHNWHEQIDSFIKPRRQGLYFSLKILHLHVLETD